MPTPLIKSLVWFGLSLPGLLISFFAMSLLDYGFFQYYGIVLANITSEPFDVFTTVMAIYPFLLIPLFLIFPRKRKDNKEPWEKTSR